MTRVGSMARSSIVAVSVALLVGGCSGNSDQTATAAGTTAGPVVSAAPTSGQSTTSPIAGTKTGAANPTKKPKPPPIDTAKPAVAVTTLPEVGVGDKAALSQGVVVVVSKIKTVQVKANGPGDIAGSGVAVYLTVKNSSAKSVDVGGFSVTASYGSDNSPASPGGSQTGTPLMGQLKSGKSAKGVYEFTVPSTKVSNVQIQVSSNSSPNILVVQR